MDRRFEVGAAALAGVIFLGMPEGASADLVVDTFGDPAGGQTVTDTTVGGTPAFGSFDGPFTGPPVLGGSREIFVDKLAQPDEAPLTAAIDGGRFEFDQDQTVQGSARLVYDGAADGLFDATGLGGLDLTAGLNTGLLLTGLSVVGDGLTLTATLYNAAGGFATSGPLSLADGFGGSLFLDYATAFGPNGAATAANLGALEIVVNGTSPGSDLAFDGLASSPAAVPEPSSVVLLSLVGVGGLVARRWRRRAAGVPAGGA